ncbi:hypothetical protein AAFF_G00353620, partial [Aldrovandia affinis]
PITVYTGIPKSKLSNRDGHGQKITVILLHPGYTGYGDPDNDIMLLKLDTAVTGDFVKLPTEDECNTVNKQAPAKTNLLVAGWGRTKPNDPKSKPDKLMCAKLKLASCPSDATNKPLSDQFCAGDAKHYTACGDSGGGLVHGNIIYGVVSMACKQEDKQVATIFTSVCYPAHLDWIKKTTGLP